MDNGRTNPPNQIPSFSLPPEHPLCRFLRQPVLPTSPSPDSPSYPAPGVSPNGLSLPVQASFSPDLALNNNGSATSGVSPIAPSNDFSETWANYLQHRNPPNIHIPSNPDVNQPLHPSPLSPSFRTVGARKRRLSSLSYADNIVRQPAGTRSPPFASLPRRRMADHANPAPTGHRRAGSSASNPMDLTADDSSMRTPPSRYHRSIHRVSRNMSGSQANTNNTDDLTLPRWQPDAEVSACPVCGAEFSFWYRKHHCRKCGRVVCANCSPHRITIPRQFIVHPSPADLANMSGGDGSPQRSSANNPNSTWGGEEVRVCNPCVPDPNMNPPGVLPAREQAALRMYQAMSGHNAPGPSNPFGGLPPHMLSFRNPSTVDDLWPPTPAPLPTYYRGAPPPPPPPQGGLMHPGMGVMYATPQVYPNLNEIPYGAGSSSVSVPVQQAPKPKQVAEEDECPVCGEELPPKGENGEENERERHVEECIAARMYSAPREEDTPRTTGQSQTQRLMDSVIRRMGSRMVDRGLGGPAQGSSARQRRGAGRMLSYLATEKDCVAEDGGENECVICLEEFEVGVEMGRLECLCRFHKKCIREWWDTKGQGTCPTHQLHD